jgi:ubiquitin-protein ligase
MRANRRILKEFERFSNESDGFSVEAVSDKEWHVKFTGAFETIYDGEEFTLRVRFGNDYPIESPEVSWFIVSLCHFICSCRSIGQTKCNRVM